MHIYALTTTFCIASSVSIVQAELCVSVFTSVSVRIVSASVLMRLPSWIEWDPCLVSGEERYVLG